MKWEVPERGHSSFEQKDAECLGYGHGLQLCMSLHDSAGHYNLSLKPSSTTCSLFYEQFLATRDIGSVPKKTPMTPGLRCLVGSSQIMDST